jgi:hypothetical protein
VHWKLASLALAIVLPVLLSVVAPLRAQQYPPADTLSFGDRLNRLEQSAGLPAAPADKSVLERLGRLETQSFGQNRPGSIIERLQNLERARPAAQTAPNLYHSAPNAVQPPTPISPQSASVSTATTTPANPAANQTPGALAAIIRQSRVANSLAFTDIYPPRFFHIPPAADSQEDNTDFLNNVFNESKGKTIRFQKQPITYYTTPIQEPGFAKAIHEAFDDWTVRTKGLVHFSEVKNKGDARIIVVFNHLGLTKDQESLGAHTVAKWKARGSGRMAVLPVGSIPVPLYIPSIGPRYTVPPQLIEVNLDVIYDHEEDVRLPLLKNIATHEGGHALGMLGHSQNKADMMYSITDEHSRISQRDINTLTRLYQRKVDIPL